MSNDLEVSVIIPAFNAAATIDETLQSLRAQTHRRWNAIVVDDGSSDETAAIASSHARDDARITVVKRSNGGEAAARNAGLSETQADWVLFLDADDWIAVTHLERLTAALAADPTLDAVHCRYARVAADGSEVVEAYQPPTGDLFPVLARRAAFPIHACIVRRRLVDEAGGFDPTLKTSPDWDLWQRIARTGARFGHVDEVLALYRMSAHGASLDGEQLLRDGLRVLRQGHVADDRVAHPHPDHIRGEPLEGIRTQEFYLLAWCAGLMLGRALDARSLLAQLPGDRYPELFAPAVARCLFEAVPLPSCRSPRAWDTLWPVIQERVSEFLGALQAHTEAPDLAANALSELKRLILGTSPASAFVADSLDALRAEVRELTGRLASSGDAESPLHGLQATLHALEESHRILLADHAALHEALQAALQQQSEARLLSEQQRVHLEETIDWARREGRALRDENDHLNDRLRGHQASQEALQLEEQRLRSRIEALTHERDQARQQEIGRLQGSAEWRVGDALWNKAGLSRVAQPAAREWRTLRDGGNRLRLRLARRRLHSSQKRAVVAACWSFPIHSQTFVYQEIHSLHAVGLDPLVFCCETNPKSELPGAFEGLWDKRVVLVSDWSLNMRDYEYFRRTHPERVASLLDRIGQATGLSEEALRHESIVMMGFTFARHVELAGAAYLHTYFFYDQSFMAMMAGYLLGIPRGVTAYADHMLQDYAFKCVPLHLELADIVVATSRRIKEELNSLSGGRFDAKILVKPNGIDTQRFPFVDPRHRLNGGGPPELVAVNRIEPKKGLTYLVEAIGILKARGRAITTNIVGGVDTHTPSSAAYYRELTAKIDALGLGTQIVLHGMKQQSEFLPILERSRIFIAPYVEVGSGDKDGIPTAVLEAMAAGLPIVATDAGSIAEVVTDGVEAISVPQRDPERLADAIERLLSETTTYIAMSEAARRRATSEFDVGVTEQQFHDRIRHCLQAYDDGRPSAAGQRTLKHE